MEALETADGSRRGRRRPGRYRSVAALLLAGSLLVACGDKDDKKTTPAAPTASQPVTLRLGYFPNVTHATALVGLEGGIFKKALGDNVVLEPKGFNAGPAAVEALFADALDATYIGPNPAINAFVKSNGVAVRIIAGATSGGAFLIAKPEITTAEQLRGKMVASPQLGGTQDVALRGWLADKGLKTNPQGGGDVSVVPQENAQTLETFQSGAISGAWVPEPWATRLIQEGGGHVLVDERDLWPQRRYVTTHLIVRTKFLKEHPDVVNRLLEGHVEATTFVTTKGDEAQELANKGIEAVTSKRLKAETIAAAWKNLEFTTDPVASSLRASAEAATAAGLLPKADLTGIYDLGPLNAILTGLGQAQVLA